MKNDVNKKLAVVSFSGGLDSSVCAKMMQNNGYEVVGVSFNYGQRNIAELESAKKIASELGIKHIILDATFISNLSPSYLTNAVDEIIIEGDNSNTFVPGRNILFGTMLAVVAHTLKAGSVVMGMNADDRTFYPDCRVEFVNSFEKTIQLGLSNEIMLITPLVDKTKVEIFQLAEELGILELVVNESNSCYNGVKGVGCGTCPACKLRRESYLKYLESVRSR